MHGVIQPLIVSPLDNSRYRIIAGERRYTAARELNIKTVPALVRTVQGHHRLSLQLIENLHRKDLDPFEESIGYQYLVDQFNLTHDEIAQQVGKSRTHITQTLSLNKIPPEIQKKCQSSDIPLSRDTLHLIAKQDSSEKMDEILQLAFNNVSHDERREQARKGKSRVEPSNTKPKRVFNTSQEATIIVQSRTPDLTIERIIAALEEALRQIKS
jgi:ParB family chromosome partitioning protein